MTSSPAPTVSGRGMTMSDLIARYSRTSPDAVAFRDGELTLTWSRTHERITRLASVLTAEGVGPGDRVAVMGLNSVPQIEAMAAILRVGAICVPVNFRLVADEVAYALTDSGATAVLVDDVFAPVVDAARAQAPDVRAVLTIGAGYEDVLAAGSPEYSELAVGDGEPAFIMYTSGTTGRPKGAVLTHRNLMVHAFSNVVHAGVSSEDRVGMSGAPLFHIAGVSGFYLNLIVCGATVLSPSGGFDPVAMVDLLERERISSVFFVPAQWAAIVAVPGIRDRDLSALRRASWGAAPASTTLLRTMIDTFPQAEIVTAFGQTECSPVTCALRGEDSIRKIGSIGTPMINVEVRVVDDDMNDVAQGEVGEIVYRGPTVMSGYWNKPEETAEAFRGGWFHSGDLVRQDEDGYLYVVDRKKDMIISGGENIYCAEVENTLAAHPKVAEVALIGVADAKYGEAPLAIIAPRDPADPPTAQDVETFCREHLAAYKRPRDVVIVAALPRNPSGKVLKTVLRDEYGASRVVAAPAV
ncbi:long-chain-fatty-acid--CoA ligase [Pseudonocardia sp. 73-21]|uniref:long-chain-fatty-acid--CoA ligase n=2 Tax=Pseudonocardia TaxID=1847 RepID=UPI000B31F9E1|nr:long-chain-fatty-acid--CoA ligase [Pseudonocardia sp. 73-21]